MSDFIDKILREIGANDCNQDVSGYLSSGFLPLDFALSGRYLGGGFPMGRISEVCGPESSGKTLIATMAMIETQRRGGLAVLLDYEHAFSLSRAVQLGLKTDRISWIYKQPESAEQGFKITELICNIVSQEGLDKPVTIVNDSVASMVTKEELDTGIGDENMRTRLALALCLSTNLKKITNAINRTNVTLIFLNQLRENPGVLFGDKETTPGGKALKYYASCRVKLHKCGKIKGEDGEIIGEGVRAQVTKNKVSEPFREAEYVEYSRRG